MSGKCPSQSHTQLLTLSRASCIALCAIPAQTAQYSTQIFSLAVLLSSLFIYNQVSTCIAHSLVLGATLWYLA